MSGVQQIEIAEDDDGQRLDRWLRRKFPQLLQSRIEKMCRKGDLRIDGGRVKPSTRVEAWQIVRVPPIVMSDKPMEKRAIKISDADAKMIRSCVLYKDDALIVLNKPAGLAVQGGSGQSRHVDMLSEALKYDLDEKPRLVHRLDKDTSGVLIMGRTQRATADLTAAFRHRETLKIYWAAVAGSPFPKMGTIKYGLHKAAGHGPNGAGERMVCVHPDEVANVEGAKRATTDYALLENLGQRVAWVALAPITGRTHQLRAHMAEIGHPVIGDGKYGSNAQTNDGDGWGAQLGGDISRKLHLHARSLSILHPKTKQTMRFVAPMPDHMTKTWDYFGWKVALAPDDPFDVEASGRR